MNKQAQQETAYPAAFTLPDKSTKITDQTKHNCPGYAPFANEFSYFMDYSGQGFGFVHVADGSWRCDVNYTLADVLTGHAMRPVCTVPLRGELNRLYRAAGFPEAQTFTAAQMTETEMREAIKYALVTLGQPVILPVESRFFGSVVMGYKDNGGTLVTFGYPPLFADWNNTQPKIEEVKNWYNAKTELTIVGKRETTPTAKEMYEEGLKQIRAYLEAGVRGEDARHSEAWENFLRKSMDEMIAEVKETRVVPGADCGKYEGPATDGDARKFIENIADPTWCDMAERRYYLMHFFNQAATHFPEEAQTMRAIASHFWKASEIMGNQQTGYISEVGHDPVNAEKFADPEVRSRMADCVRRFREADAKGLEMVEELLKRMGFAANETL